MKGSKSPSPTNKQTCFVTRVFNYCVVGDPPHKYFLSSPPTSSTFNLFSIRLHFDIMGGADTFETLAYGVIWKKRLREFGYTL